MKKITPIRTDMDMKLERSENRALMSYLHLDSKNLTITNSNSIDTKLSPLGSHDFRSEIFDNIDLLKKTANGDDEEIPTAKSFASVKRFALLNRSLYSPKNSPANPEAQSYIISNHHQLKTKNSNLKDIALTLKKHKIEGIEENKEELEQTNREYNQQDRQHIFKGVIEEMVKTRANDSRDLSDNKKGGQ